MSPAELVRRPQELGDPLELLDREPSGQHRMPVRGHRAPDPSGRFVERRSDLQPDSPAIGVVRHASRIAGPLEAVDHPGHGAGGEPGLVGQLARGQPSRVLDDVETAKVALADAQPLGGQAVERIVLVAADPELADQLVDQFLL
jgi:hypothetical protein